MKIKKLDHIGIAVKDVSKVMPFFNSCLRLKKMQTEMLGNMKLRIGKICVGQTMLEFLQPLEGEAVISKFLSKHGGGIHHICFEVDNLKKATEELTVKGYTPLYVKPQRGADHKWVNFLQPKETLGILIELNQPMKRQKIITQKACNSEK